MFKKILNHWQLLFLIGVILFFFKPFIFEGKIPIPSDTIVGMYHPFRDVVWDGLTVGVPFKNFLITDPVRQQYPWRLLSIELLKNWQWPLWNPYNFSGTPLLANLQSAAFYPLNLIFWLLPFSTAWGVQVSLQLVLAGLFFYLWLRIYNLNKIACLFGSLSFIFSGFFVAWLEWNTILQVALWLPLILLAKEKLIRIISLRAKRREDLFDKKIFLWALVLIFAETSSFLAGHLQTFFYVILVSTLYLLVRLWQVTKFKGRIKYQLTLFLATASMVFLVSSPQLLPLLEFIFNSARSFDQPLGFRTDWYLPWKHLVQFLVPDFFGNPTTLNYWGSWNYGEFVGYIGVIPLLLAITAILGRRDKKTLFFTVLTVISLVFALPNFISFLPYQLKLPFLSTTAPSRLIFITDFSLAVLAALGLDFVLKQKKIKYVFWSGFILLLLYVFLLVIISTNTPLTLNLFQSEKINLLVAKRNLYLPTGLFAIGWLFLVLVVIARSETTKQSILSDKKIATPRSVSQTGLAMTLTIFLLLLTSFDLLRFSQKFNPFVKKNWLFPQTETIKFLQSQQKPFRIESLDDRILPPNFSAVYGLETIEGYDPLFDSRYAEFMAALLRNQPDISSFRFNRIVTPKLYNNSFINLLNVKYFLTLSPLNSPEVKKVFQEGQTSVYENTEVLPRVFFVNNLVNVSSKQEAINWLFSHKNELDNTAVVEKEVSLPAVAKNAIVVKAAIIQSAPQKLTIETTTNNPSFLVASQTFYPGWKAQIDGVKTTIYRTDYVLSGILVPAGKHNIVFYYQPLSYLIGLANFGLGMVFLLLGGIKVWLKRK